MNLKLHAAPRLRHELEAEVEVSASSAKASVDSLIKAARAMSPRQLKALVTGIIQIDKWLKGGHDGKSFQDKIIVEGAQDSASTLMVNAMKYLVAYFFTEARQGFEVVYRLHDLRDTKVSAGNKVLITPHKSVLSWTTRQVPEVLGRKATPGDSIIARKVKASEVVWSYKVNLYFHDWSKAYGEYLATTPWYEKRPDLKGTIHAFYHYLDALFWDVSDYLGEKEVVLYNGAAPFEAQVVKPPKLDKASRI